MLIRFIKPDPRAGLVSQMDSHRGQQLIDEGAAQKFKEGGDDQQPVAVEDKPIKKSKK